MLVLSAPASAKEVHAFKSAFTACANEPTPCIQGSFAEPGGLAVAEESGDVYVADTGNNRVLHFGAEGASFKGEITHGFSEPTQVAVDNSTDPLDPSRGDIYVADFGNHAIDKFSPTGTFLGQITLGANAEPLGEIDGLAVDPQGNVWVYQGSGEIDSYSNTEPNAFLASTASPFGASPGFGVDPEDNLYINRGASLVAKLSSSGEVLIGNVNPEEPPASESGTATAVAVNQATDEVFIDEGFAEPGLISGYSKEGAPLEHFGQGHLSASHGVAVDAATNVVYVSNRTSGEVAIFEPVLAPDIETGEASGLLGPEGMAALNGTVDPHGINISDCRFEYGKTSAYGQSEPCATTPSGNAPQSVQAPITGLEAAHYHFRLVIETEFGESAGADHGFIASVKPAITAEALAAQGASAVTLSAQIDPGGLGTTYFLEYGTGTGYGSKSSEATLPAAFGPNGVQIQITGLSSASTYHARFVAVSARASVPGEDIEFTTAAGAGGGESSCPNRGNLGFSALLPDCRAYELVSAAEPGEVYAPEAQQTLPFSPSDTPTEFPMRAAAGGGAVTYVAEPGSAGGVGNGGRGLGNQFFASRNPAAGGWDTQNITPTSSIGTVSISSPYEGFSPDLSLGVMGSNSSVFAANASPPGPAPCNVLYTHHAGAPPTQLQPLFTSTLTPSSCGFLSRIESASASRRLVFAGGNEGTATVAPYSHLLFQSPAPLAPGTQPSLGSEEGSNLYLSVNSSAEALSVLPGGEISSDAVFGGAPLNFHFYYPDLSNAISADGSRVFWTEMTDHSLYVREAAGTGAARTDQLDLPNEGVAGSGGDGQFWTATPDGSRVFFTDCRQLTLDSTAVPAEECQREQLETTQAALIGSDLYEYNFAAPARRRLSDLTVDHEAGDPLGADVKGVIGTSADGSYVYFVASGALAPGAEHHTCRPANLEERELEREGMLTEELTHRLEAEAAEERQGKLPPGRGCNLYVRHGGQTDFIAALSPSDNEFLRQSARGLQQLGVWSPELGSRTAAVIPDGKSLVFQSVRPLTGYDNSSLISGRGNDKFLAEIFVYDATTGHITCASCDPAGAPPTPEREGGGTYLPVSLAPTFTRRLISGDGSRVFFNTSQPLSSRDVNGIQDVYEWEREGTAGCPRATSKWGGCISLLSGGQSASRSYFVDASGDGSDVFFTHRGELGGLGGAGGKIGLFDARAEGGFLQQQSGCAAAACAAGPPPPAFGTPPTTATANGPGNAVACPKDKVKKNGKCVKKKAKHHKKKHKKKHHNKKQRHARAAARRLAETNRGAAK